MSPRETFAQAQDHVRLRVVPDTYTSFTSDTPTHQALERIRLPVKLKLKFMVMPVLCVSHYSGIRRVRQLALGCESN